MRKLLLILTLLPLLFASCAEEEFPRRHTERDLKVTAPDDVRNLSPISNSSLINNPISADAPANPGDMAAITFKEETINFGDVKAGEVVMKTFEFTNTGKSPLVISEAQASCGCTVPEWPRAPLNPGETGKIIAKFDSNGKSGKQDKTITVVSNTNPNKTILRIKGNVIGDTPPSSN